MNVWLLDSDVPGNLHQQYALKRRWRWGDDSLDMASVEGLSRTKGATGVLRTGHVCLVGRKIPTLLQ